MHDVNLSQKKTENVPPRATVDFRETKAFPLLQAAESAVPSTVVEGPFRSTTPVVGDDKEERRFRSLPQQNSPHLLGINSGTTWYNS